MFPKNNMAKRKKKLVIKTAKHWDAISNSTRAEILEVLSASGNRPATIKEIANTMGRSAELIHHHMAILLDAGLVNECEPRQLARHKEKTFMEVAEYWSYDIKSDPESFVDGFLRMTKAFSRANERKISNCMEGKTGKQLAELHREKILRVESGRLTETEYKRVRRHISALMEIFAKARTRTDGDLFTMLWSIVPVESDSN